MKEHNDSLGYLLNHAARLIKLDFTTRMSKLGITFPQFLVLKDIFINEGFYHDNESLTLAAIAKRLNSNRPNMTGIIERLEKQGLINRAINPKDKRAHIITLTDEAKALMEQLYLVGKETTDKALDGFSEAESHVVREYIVRIINNLDSQKGVKL